MDAVAFLADLEAKPAALRALAGYLRGHDPWAAVRSGRQRVVFLGMGSSRYAADVIAARLRAAGVDAAAEYASSVASYPPDPGTLAVAISATGSSRETVDAAASYAGRSPLVAVTANPVSPLGAIADMTIDLRAGEENGGVACRTFQHTLLLLLAMTRDHGSVAGLAKRAAEASEDLLSRRPEWLPGACEVLDGPDGVYTIAPAERLSSARQSALMIREGPRRQAAACETGDWAHVDVYLTKTLDYRAILFAGSRYDEQAMDWVRQRGAKVLAIGLDVPGARRVIRYRHDEEPDVALVTETLIAELVAAQWRVYAP